jgi:hypothetical protein
MFPFGLGGNWPLRISLLLHEPSSYIISLSKLYLKSLMSGLEGNFLIEKRLLLYLE